MSETDENVSKVKRKSSMPKNLILFTICTSIMLNAILYVIMVPILKSFLPDDSNSETEENANEVVKFMNKLNTTEHFDDKFDVFVASKAIVQLIISMFIGSFIDYVGYDISYFIGAFIIFSSTTTFAFSYFSSTTFALSFTFLFVIRCLQGCGSAFFDTSTFALIGNQYRKKEKCRHRAFGILLVVISFGSLIAIPFSDLMYTYIGQRDLFLSLGFTVLLSGILLLFVVRPHINATKNRELTRKPRCVPIWRLLADPYVIICMLALLISNTSLALLEPTVSNWMINTNITYHRSNDINKTKMLYFDIPGFIAHLIGVFFTIWFCRIYSHHVYIIASIGLFLQGISCFIMPFYKTFGNLAFVISICGTYFGKGVVYTALLPFLGLLVDLKRTELYGGIYALASISYSISDAIGPFLANYINDIFTFDIMMKVISSVSLLYAPVLYFLRSFYRLHEYSSASIVLQPQARIYYNYNTDRLRRENGIPMKKSRSLSIIKEEKLSFV